MVACGSGEEAVQEEELAVISRQNLEESCYDRDNALLQGLKADGGTRACNFDEDCPWGSFCNESTRACDWKCLESGPANMACPTGQVCNCSGRCVAEGASEPLVLSTKLPRLDLTPTYVEFTPPVNGVNFRAHRLTVGLAVVDATAASNAASTPVRLAAGPEMEVSCSAPSDDASAVYDTECTLSSWSFSAFGTGMRAEKQVLVRPKMNSTASAWHITLESSGITPQRTRLQAERAGLAPGNGGGVRPFWGTVSLWTGASDGGTDKVVLPVRAYASSQFLFLYDETRTLSPSGKVRLSTSQTTQGMPWLPSGDGGIAQDAVTAEVQGTYDGTAVGDHTFSGTFTVRLPRPVGSNWVMEARYELSRLTEEGDGGVQDIALTACPVNSCQAGSVCELDLGVCVPGVATWSGAANGTNTIVQEQRLAWDSEAQTKLTAFMNESAAANHPLTPQQLTRGIVCNQDGTAGDVNGFPSYATVDGALSHVLPSSGDLLCQNGQAPYVADLFTQKDRYPDINGVKNLERLTEEEMLTECLQDLGRAPVNGSSLSGTAWFSNRFGTKYSVRSSRTAISTGRTTPGRCLNLARFYAALHLSTREATSRDQRLTWRLLQEWIAIHGYVAQQLVQHREAADFLNQQPNTPWPSVPSMLDRFEQAWDLLLDGTYAGLMPGNDATRTCSLLNPDYRLPPAPVASWWRDSESGLFEQDRGLGARWQRSKATFFFHNPNVWSQCTSSTATNLAFASYLADGVSTAPRSLTTTCALQSGSVEVTVQSARKTVTNGSALSFWYPQVPSNPSGIAFAVVDQGTSFSFYNGQQYITPTLRTLTYEHASLRPPFSVNVDPPARSRLAVWDFVAEDGMLADAIANPSAYDTSSADMAPLPGDLPHHDQGVGLPALILEGVAAHLRLLNVELEAVERTTLANCAPVTQGTPRDQALARFGRTMRYALLLEAMARSAYANERSACGQTTVELSWDKRWRDAQAELEAVRHQSYEKLRAISNCRPYGMPEDEAPLFFGSTATSPTERYFGSSINLYNTAMSDLSRAKTARDQAEAAWVSMRSSEVQEELNDQAKAQHILELKRQYGAPIVQMCGLTEVPSEDVLDRFDPVKSMARWGLPALRPESCFLKRTDAACQVQPQQVFARVTPENARFTFCTWNKLGQHAALPAEVQPFTEQYGSKVYTVFSETNSSGGVSYYVGIQGNASARLPVERLYGRPVDLQQVPPEVPAEAHEACVQEMGSTGVLLPTPSSIGKALDSSCYRGEMGSAMLTIVGANQNLQVAQSQWGEFQERFDIAQQRCKLMESSAQKQQALDAEYQRSMSALIRQKASVDRKVNNISDVNNNADTIAALGASIATQNWVNVAWNSIKLFGGGVENRYKDQSIRLGEQIQQLELQHKTAIESLQLESAVQQCYTEAQMHLVGIRTSALQVDRVETEVDASLLALENMEGRVTQLLLEGKQVVAQEEGRQIAHFSHDFWLDSRIVTARELFATARRSGFLFSKALEYEKQQSHPALGAILAATGPNQLELALNQYAFQVLDKTVNGAEPDDGQFVVQLRGHVLMLEDRYSVPSGERSLSKGERFTRRLLSPDNAVYDDNGNYLGQGLRFSMPNGVSPFRCGERVWTVHAHLAGDDRLAAWIEREGPAPLILRKRNTFSSHLCAEEGWQTRAVRPSLRSGAGTAKPGEEGTFTLASVSALTGLSPLQFTTNPVGDGSTEWKGRGLYGDYEILFPWVGLMTRNGSSRNFPLDGVTDVWLRFDEVSVATPIVYE